MRDEVRCPAGRGSQPRHSGGAGAPPGSTMRPCQELADDLSIALSPSGLLERDGSVPKLFEPDGALRLPECVTPKRKRGPAVRQITACGAPRGARRGPQGSRSHRFALFGAPPPSGPTSWVSLENSKPRMRHTHRGDEGARLNGRDAATGSIPPPRGEVGARMRAGWGVASDNRSAPWARCPHPSVTRSDDAFRRRRGGGVLRRWDTHPTRRALRARLPPHQGEGWSSLRRAK
jgi:hypothetical protein